MTQGAQGGAQPPDPDAPIFDGPPLSLEEELAAARAEPEAGPDIATVNESLADGLNRCPKCGSTDVQLRATTGMLVCLFCRHEWQESRVEEEFGLGEGIDDLEGTVVAGGAEEISADADDVLTLKCGGCGAEVVVDTAHAMNARCHWCRHTLNVNQQTANGAVPDAVLPFRLTHAEAVEKIREFASRRRLFAHPRFKKEFVPDNVLGVYLPYLVIDARAEAAYSGRGEVQTRRWTEKNGDNQTTYYAADVHLLVLPAHTPVELRQRALHLRAADREELVLQHGVQVRHVEVALLAGEADEIAGVPLDGVLGVERQDRVDDVVGRGAVDLRAVRRPLDGEVVDGERHRPVDAVDVRGVVRRRAVAGLLGPATRLHLARPDEFEAVQPTYVVYHDDIGDYSTNEPTMDGTADAVWMFAVMNEPDGR